MNLKFDLEIVTIERQGSDLVYVEGRAISNDAQAAFFFQPQQLGELPQPGQRVTLTLTGAVAAAPSLRERMQPPKTATTNTPPTTAARSQTTAGSRQDASGLLLAGILGNTSTSMPERDVDDEMNALLGPPRRKG